MFRIFKEKKFFPFFYQDISIFLDVLQIYLICIFLFLLLIPLPSTWPFIPTKVFLLSLFLAISIIFSLIKIIKNRIIKIPLNLIVLSFLVFLIISSISSYLSSARYFSIYANLSSSHSLLSYILYFLTLLIILININKDQLLEKLHLLVLSLSLSIFINNIILTLSLYRPLSQFLLPSLTEVLILTSFYFLMSVLIFSQKLNFIQQKTKYVLFLKSLMIINLMLSLIILIIFNFQFIWFSLAILFFILILNELFHNMTLSKNVSFLLLAVFFFFLYITSQDMGIFILSKLPNLPQELRPNFSLSINIAFNTLKTNPVFGTGPSTFVYSWLKFRPSTLNLQNLENLRFDQGFNLLITLITETGFLGLIIFLFFLFYSLFWFLLKIKDNKNFIFVVPTFYLLITTFFFPSYFLHLAMLFIFLGISLINEPNSLTINFLNTERTEILIGIILILFMIIPIIGLYHITKNFLAEVFYSRYLNEISKNNIDRAINNLNLSTILSPTSDLHLRELSAILLQRANIEAGLPNPNIQLIQNLLTYSFQTAQMAIFLNPLEPLNYFTLANIYENLFSLNPQFYNLAIEAYKKASEQDPYNPIYYIRMALLHYTNKDKEKGDVELKKAYLLKPNDQQILQLIRQYMIK